LLSRFIPEWQALGLFRERRAALSVLAAESPCEDEDLAFRITALSHVAVDPEMITVPAVRRLLAHGPHLQVFVPKSVTFLSPMCLQLERLDLPKPIVRVGS
jgi:hypothetical protein